MRGDPENACGRGLERLRGAASALTDRAGSWLDGLRERLGWQSSGRPITGRVMVVVSHYNPRPSRELIALLDALHTCPAGWPFRVRVVVNQQMPECLVLPTRHRSVEVCYRENTGFNIGAWEHGWRLKPACNSYLFLQEECRLVRAGWLAGFVRRASEPGVGLVGERLSPPWDRPWEELRRRFRGHRLPGHDLNGQPADRVDCYVHFLAKRGIPLGSRGDHLQSLILFARRRTLEAIGGLPVGASYGEAIAAEIGISKRVQALGLRICEVGPEPFWFFEHPQWLERATQHRRAA